VNAIRKKYSVSVREREQIVKFVDARIICHTYCFVLNWLADVDNIKELLSD
jgi:hypothetical protein